MRRRDIIAGLGAAVGPALFPGAAGAQQPEVPVIGWLDLRSSNAPPDFINAFRLGLAQMGFVEGRNVAFDHRYADGHRERLPAFAADLVLRRVAVIAAPSGASGLAAKAATRIVPVVFFTGFDPVGLGLVESLNHPGGNITGVAILSVEITVKRLELLHKLIPTAQSIAAMLVGPADGPNNQAETRDLESAARALGVRVLLLNARNDTDIPAAFATAVEQRAGALLVGASVTLDAARNEIISLAARHAIPTMFFYSSSVSAGGLLSYGPDTAEASRQSGIYAGRILKGDKPADLPVVQSAKFELVINLQTARLLGIEVPPTLLALADKVIE